jgi:hypothetical protein
LRDPTHHAQEPSSPEGVALATMAGFELSTLNASERIYPDRWQRYRHCRSDIAIQKRPETHQNLIHHDKEQAALRSILRSAGTV